MQVVLGGGISGLSAAYYLLKFGCKSKVQVLEGGSRVGGWIWTSKRKSGLLFEKGPRTVRPRFETGLNTLQLIEELNIAHLVRGIPASHPTAKNRMIFVNGQLHPLPSSFKELFVKVPPFSKPLVAALLHDLKASKKILNDESIYSFVDRRLGRELADYVISPMICGICAGDAREISVKFIAKSLFEFEQKHGSISKGLIAAAWTNRKKLWKKSSLSPIPGTLAFRAKQELWSVWSLEGGLEVLPQTMLESIQIKGAEVKLNSDCSEIFFNDKGAVLSVGDKKIQARRVISTVPAKRLASLVTNQHPLLSEELSKIPSVTVAVVNLAFKGNVLDHNAFGFLIPPSEKRSILGVTFDSCCFPQNDFTVMTVMMGGHWFESRLGFSFSKDDLLKIALSEVHSILKIAQDPCDYQVSILRDCIPQYLVGHFDRVQKIRNYIQEHGLPLSVAGSSYDGVGVNDVIFSAKQAAQVNV